MADLPIVLVLAARPVRLHTSAAASAGEARVLDCRWYTGDAELGVALARERPDVIVSFGHRAAFPRLQAAAHDVQRRWLHVESPAPSADEVVRAGDLAFRLFLDLALARGAQSRLPLVSVFTPTWHPGERIRRAYDSLLAQAYDNWEWVILDDSHDDGRTLAVLHDLAHAEPRLSIYSSHRPSGRIGEVKRQACALSRGTILVELDHDDRLTPNALSDVVHAFEHDPLTGFVYSDWAVVDEDSGECLSYGEPWAFGFGRYRTEEHGGRGLLVAVAPPINASTIRHIVGVPNHVRAWRRDVYWQVGGHNPALHVADDYDLLVRTFLHTPMTHIPRLCYIQHQHRGHSAQDLRRAEIQRLVRALREHYEPSIQLRLRELGWDDPFGHEAASVGPPDAGTRSPSACAVAESRTAPHAPVGGREDASVRADRPSMHELCVTCYGVGIRITETPGTGVCAALRTLLPPEAHPCDGGKAEVVYDVRDAAGTAVGDTAWTVSRDGHTAWSSRRFEDALQWLRSDIDHQVALTTRVGLFVHAGVVGWRGRAIVIPGRSRTGKTTLVEELVRRGAVYYSDEYAVLDDEGRVHPYARRPSPRENAAAARSAPPHDPGTVTRPPLPIGLLVSAPYCGGVPWRPETVRGSRGVLPLIDNTVVARREPEWMMRVVAIAARRVVTLQGLRPDASVVASAILRVLDDLLDGHAESSLAHTRPSAVTRRAVQSSPRSTAGGAITTADVSYVVPTALPHDHLRRCLESIRVWSPDSEVIVVANGCAPAAEARALADRVVELQCNLRFGAGANRGALEASRRLLCVMNDDARFVDQTPDRLVRAAAAGRIAGPYSNRAKPPQGEIEASQVPEASRAAEMVSGFCMMMRGDLFATLGGFDTRLDTWEDDDLCARAARIGVGCEVVGGAYVVHEGGATFRAQAENVDAIMRRSALTFRRMHPSIGVIAIARDEAGAIGEFFRQFESLTRAWCLLDTGSTDETRDQARRLGARVETAPFRDFASARNLALDTFASAFDWVVMLDPDERLDSHTIRHLEALAAADSYDIFLAPLRAVSPDGSTTPFVPKPFLFRRAAGIRWTFLVHEKLIGSARQALVWNAAIDHQLGLHERDRRAAAERLYADLQSREPYFTNPRHRQQMRTRWPILDYDRLDDERLHKRALGPLVSVIIPTFRRSTLLARAVASALAQDYLNLEVVVVGDACPDLEAAKFEDPRVRVVNLPEHHGAGGAVPRNHGIALAAGELIAYLDDDNAWLPDHVSSIYEAMRAAGAPFGFSSMQVDGNDLGFAEPRHQGIDTSCVVHHKALIARCGWWRGRDEVGYAHDWEFMRRAIAAAKSWVCTRRPTLLYGTETSGQQAFLQRLSTQATD